MQLSSLFDGVSRKSLTRLPRRRWQPVLERLEDRLAPALIAVTTTADVVANDGQTSLREAINQANATASEDTITLPAGVYEIAIPGRGENANASGDFDITNPVIIKGNAAASTIIDGNSLDRVFNVNLTGNATFSKVTIRNGFTNDDGGGIQTDDGDLTIKKSVITGNFAVNGGGIESKSGNVMVKDSLVSDNMAEDFNGGGIDLLGPGDLTLINSTVTQNTARTTGGGISIQLGSTVTLTDSTVSANVAGGDGGGIHSFSDVTLTNSIISDNVAGENGGGIESAGNATTVRLTNSTVSGNVADENAGQGGGIDTDRGTVVLTNSTVSGNLARAKGGGIQTDSGAVKLLSNSTVRGNRADLGGGIQSDSGTVALNQSTVSGNVARTNGGGIETVSGDVTIDFSTISGNRANGDQGGEIRTGLGGNIFVNSSTIRGNTAKIDGGGIYSDANVMISASTISGNRVGDDGGGLHVNTTSIVTLIDVTLSGNLADDQGGGMYNAGDTSFQSVTVTRNGAGEGGGIFNAVGNFRVNNTIIAQNLAARAAAASRPDVNGTFTSLGHNLVGIVDGSTGFTQTGDQVGTAAVPINARLSPLADNGGPTLTHALKSGSLAIDTGDNASAPLIDQRGIARPRDGDGNGSLIVDIGAFER